MEIKRAEALTYRFVLNVAEAAVKTIESYRKCARQVGSALPDTGLTLIIAMKIVAYICEDKSLLSSVRRSNAYYFAETLLTTSSEEVSDMISHETDIIFEIVEMFREMIPIPT
jgi:hypothetical protein